MKSTTRFTIALAVLLLLGTAGPVAAQVVKGSISGTIVDKTGATVPEAAVKATQKATGRVAEITTDNSGSFRFPLLDVGSYNIEVIKAGFRKLSLTDVSVSSGADRGLGNLQLEVGEVTTVVEVNAAPPLLQASEAQISNAINFQELTRIPGLLENQGLDNIALFIPGVNSTRDQSFSNSNGASFSSNGLRGRSNDQQFDGQNNNDNSVTGPAIFIANPEFVEEYQIITGNFGPEWGRNSGSVVNIVTKSGTNNWRGSMFATYGNSALNSLSNTEKFFQGLTKPPRFQNTFAGGTAGGPLIKDKLFWFGGVDTQLIISKGVDASTSLTPTPLGLATLAACFPASTAVQALRTFGPFGVGGGNPTVSPGSTQILSAGVTCPSVEVGQVQRTLSNSYHLYEFLNRVDWNITNKDRIYGRFMWQKATSFNSDAFGTSAAGYPANVPSLSQALGISYTRTISSRMLNELRINYSRLDVEFGGNGIGNTIPSKSAIDQALTRVTFSATNLLGWGPATNAPQGRLVKTWQLQDNWNWSLGRHQLKAGVNWTYQVSPNSFLPNLNGSFRFTNLTALGANTPNRIQVGLGIPLLEFKEHQLFFYVGDSWRIRPDLTLDLGLTYSYYGQPANLFNELTTKREATASTAFFNPALPLAIRTFPKIPAPKNSVGPSVGFAYTPNWGGFLGKLMGNGKTVYRGGYRLTYDPPYYNIYLNISSATPQVLLQTLTGATAAGIPMPANPTGPTVRSLLASSLVLGVSDPRSFNQTDITRNFGPQRVHSWSFGVQREFARNVVAEVRYVGNNGTKLFQSINGNPRIDIFSAFPSVISGLTPCPAASAVVTLAVGRVDCNLGVVRRRTNTGYSWYHGVQSNLRTSNLWKQLTLTSSYTFSRTIDNVSEIFGTNAAGTTTAFSQNPLDFNKGERGLSGIHFKHNWSVTFQEDIPIFREQKGVVGKILGGWSVSAAYIIVSGQPYSPVQFSLGGNSEFFPFATGENLRPFVGSPSAPVTSVGIMAADACGFFGTPAVCAAAPTQLFDFGVLNFTSGNLVPTETTVSQNQVRFIVNAAQSATTFGTPFGNAGRNTLRNYQTNTGNFALYKTIKWSEHLSLRWHMTMTNVFNHPNFSSVDPFLDDAGFSSEGTGFANPRLTSGGNRVITFGFRLGF